MDNQKETVFRHEILAALLAGFRFGYASYKSRTWIKGDWSLRNPDSTAPVKSTAFVVAMTAVAVTLLFPRFSYNDPDTFWHIELGLYMLDHRTVLHHAIHTFYHDQLPYIPHEYAFQLVLAALYGIFGWPGTYLLTALCLFGLIMGLDRLTRVSRREIGLPERHPLLLLVVLIAASWIYYNYFTTRPQMVSAWMIVWFVVFLREFQSRPHLRFAAGMIVLSLAIANFHAGVWLVIAVFTGMALLEALAEHRLTQQRMIVFGLILFAGLLNPSGLKGILFILTVTQENYNMLINEWQPIAFSRLDHVPIMLALLVFAAALPFSLHRKPFRYMLMLGVLYLGVSSYKMNLYLWLFLPYFLATVPDQLPIFGRIADKLPLCRRFAKRLHPNGFKRSVMAGLLAGLCLNTSLVFISPPAVDAKSYPVEEMNFILARHAEQDRPKVMAPYGASGYVMFRGGDILCDGRQDPFITDHSIGALGWNAFQRSMYGYGEYLPEIVAADQPDYVIARHDVSAKLLEDWAGHFGEPVFKGRFGVVFAIDS
jgi:hypothetical protein